VLGQAHTPRRRLLSLGALAVLVLAAPALGLAGGGQSAASLRGQNARLEARSRSAVLELYSLDQRLVNAQSRLTSLDRDAATLRGERASLTAQLAVARRGNRLAQQALAQRLRMVYEQGDVEPLEILLGSRNLDEAITGLESLNRMAAQSQEVLKQLERARKVLTTDAARLVKREAALEAATLQARTIAATLTRTRAARSTYIDGLAATRRMNEREIATLVAEARAARLRSEEVAATAAAAAGAAPIVVSERSSAAGRTITVLATGYSMPGTTSTGLGVGWGVAAVDPSVIPLGTHMTIPGYGDAIAADTGGAVVGSTVDLWFPTTAQANAWGRRTVTITLH
jgi:3D (Asp-Asp-Asp) domain-containing protein